MDKKKGIMIGSIVAVVLLAVVAAFAIIKLLNKGPAEYTVSFDSKGGEEVEKVKVKKDDDLILPTTTKEGYNFLGWYNEKDEKAESKVKVTKDMSFYAKWEEIPKENTFTVTFDSKGGSAVNPLVLKCDTELTLPTAPSRDGYTFDGWEDRNGRAILDQALFTCEDVTLYAKWIKKETPKKEETKKEEKPVEKKKEYTCPDGYTLSGTKCIMEGTTKEKCPDGTHPYSGGACVTLKDSVRKDYQYKCKQEFITYNSYAANTDGTPLKWGRMGCAYYKTPDTTKSECESHGFTWVTSATTCYVKWVGGDTNLEKSCSHLSNYVNVPDPNSFSGVNGLNSGCYPSSAKVKYCDDGFTLTNDKCVKTIDATLK